MLQGEMTHHLGYGKHEAAGRGTGNSRNGTSTKKLQSELGEVTIAVPRDRRAAPGWRPRRATAPRMAGRAGKVRVGWLDRSWTD
jgi:transposase-like protein